MPKILDNFRFSSGSNVGRGGMEAKVASAWDAAQAGVTTVIANGKLPSVLLRVSALALRLQSICTLSLKCLGSEDHNKAVRSMSRQYTSCVGTAEKLPQQAS